MSWDRAKFEKVVKKLDQCSSDKVCNWIKGRFECKTDEMTKNMDMMMDSLSEKELLACLEFASHRNAAILDIPVYTTILPGTSAESQAEPTKKSSSARKAHSKARRSYPLSNCGPAPSSKQRRCCLIVGFMVDS